jgi:hypothetical protein
MVSDGSIGNETVELGLVGDNGQRCVGDMQSGSEASGQGLSFSELRWELQARSVQVGGLSRGRLS